MRQTAWLQATPQPTPEKTKNPKLKKTTEKSRLERLKANGKQPDYPPRPAYYHLVDYLWEVGPFTSTGMGAAPVSFAEITAWQQGVGVDLSAWEFSTLRALSVAYTAEDAAASSDPDRKPPFDAGEQLRALRAQELNDKLDAFLN